MSNKRLYEEGEPLQDDPELNEQLRNLRPDDPGFDAWLKQQYGYNPHLKAAEPKIKVKRRKSSRSGHS